MSNLTVRNNALQSRATNRNANAVLLSDAQGGDWAIVDCSGSMDMPTPTKDMRRIDCVREAMKPYANKLRVLAFGLSDFEEGDVREVRADAIPAPYGSTHLDRALKVLAGRKADYTLVMSDGRVNNEAGAYEAARSCSGIIDTLYIGDNDPIAENFMRELARIGHGTLPAFQPGPESARLHASRGRVVAATVIERHPAVNRRGAARKRR